MSIAENYKRIREELPAHVRLVVAAKKRTPAEIAELIDAGAADIGENYVQEAERLHAALGPAASGIRWHMIGDLQANKINKALKIFDMVQTVDSFEKAEALNKRVPASGRQKIKVLIEINAGAEASKSGASPDGALVEDLAGRIGSLEHVELAGLMTMGPLTAEAEECRPYFCLVKRMFDRLRDLKIPGFSAEVLSMGMSDSYRVAVEEGANMVRIGTAIFGSRPAAG